MLLESDSDVDEYIGWLRVDNNPESRVLELWQRTAKTRLTAIHTEESTVNDIIKEYPRIADPTGYVLVMLLVHCLKIACSLLPLGRPMLRYFLAVCLSI